MLTGTPCISQPKLTKKKTTQIPKVYIKDVLVDWWGGLTVVVVAMFHHNVHPQVFFAMRAMRTKQATHLFLSAALVQMSSEPFRVFVASLTVGTLMP